jgi:hypothetical protein
MEETIVAGDRGEVSARTHGDCTVIDANDEAVDSPGYGEVSGSEVDSGCWRIERTAVDRHVEGIVFGNDEVLNGLPPGDTAARIGGERRRVQDDMSADATALLRRDAQLLELGRERRRGQDIVAPQPGQPEQGQPLAAQMRVRVRRRAPDPRLVPVRERLPEVTFHHVRPDAQRPVRQATQPGGQVPGDPRTYDPVEPARRPDAHVFQQVPQLPRRLHPGPRSVPPARRARSARSIRSITSAAVIRAIRPWRGSASDASPPTPGSE